MIIDSYILHEDILNTATTIYYIFNEFISITENLTELNIPVPKFLKKFLENKGDDKS